MKCANVFGGAKKWAALPGYLNRVPCSFSPFWKMNDITWSIIGFRRFQDTLCRTVTYRSYNLEDSQLIPDISLFCANMPCFIQDHNNQFLDCEFLAAFYHDLFFKFTFLGAYCFHLFNSYLIYLLQITFSLMFSLVIAFVSDALHIASDRASTSSHDVSFSFEFYELVSLAR